MEHPLPARPSFLPLRPGSTTTPTLSFTSADAGPSHLSLPPLPHNTVRPTPLASSSFLGKAAAATTSPSGGCLICSNPPKYTCPRCLIKTCSLPCSKIHKTRDECSGLRDPAAFVSLKEYGQGAWSDDYKWLEEGRRKVGGWGQGIKVEELPASSSLHRPGNGRGGDRDRDKQARNRRGKKTGKVDGLRRELEKRGCSVHFMPEGMAKRKSNQSSWNPKSQQLYLTVNFIIPTNLLEGNPASPSSSGPTSFKTVNHTRVLFASNNSTSTTLPTITSLLPKELASTPIVLLLPFHSTPSQLAPEHTSGQQLFYPPLDPFKALNEALKGTAWIEFPVIQVMERERWEDGSQKGDMAVVPLIEPLVSVRDAGWGKRKAVAADASIVTNGGGAEINANAEEPGEAKRAKLDSGADGGGGVGLMALGDYVSDDEDDGSASESEYHEVVGHEELNDVGAADMDVGEPPIEVLQAVGAALIADLGEAA
ncbi:hypothetical protein I316_05044 [Kwoniella heveanensis BCC8398]|uniref:HIT-type domain-containing protein n=1 Tax=Kwoniella heveanensis BCC8398 TaxID=1296120 RepID=A0A1B9GQM3_9TREE|nr:hypothetical protein I316_05044 [Kwoniella heveanensis BCC8398]